MSILLHMAENADAVANHFYEQGKTDAIRDIIAKSIKSNGNNRTYDETTFGGSGKVKETWNKWSLVLFILFFVWNNIFI